MGTEEMTVCTGTAFNLRLRRSKPSPLGKVCHAVAERGTFQKQNLSRKARSAIEAVYCCL